MTSILQSYFKQHKSPEAPTYLRIKVIPKSPKNEVINIAKDETHGDTIKIRIKAVPEKGKANQELIKFIAKELNISKTQTSIISGQNDRLKLLKITL